MDSIVDNRERAMTSYTFAITIGFLIGNFLGGVLVDWLGFQAGFVLSGALAAGSIGLLLMEQLVAGDRRSDPTRGDEGRPVPTGGTGSGSLAHALRQPELASVGMVSFTIAFFLSLGASYFPLYGLSVGLSLTEVGLVRSMQSLMMVVFTQVARWPMRWWGHRRASYVAVVSQSAVLMATPGLVLFWPLMALYGVNGALRGVMHTANAVGLAESTAASGVSRGLAASIYNTSRDVGNISSPILGGLVASAVGLGTMFLVVPPLTVAAALGTVGVLELRARRVASRAAQAV
jgi:MFS family permease